MKKIKDVRLAFSCSAQKENFIKNEKGFFCKQCSHHIVDFTKKSAEDLESEINNSIGSICGIFKRDQLSEHFLKYAAATLIITSSIATVNYAQPISGSVSKQDVISETLIGDVVFGTVEQMAEPIGGYEKFFEALTKEIKYPRGLTTKGKCFIEFIIDLNGHATNYRIIKGFDSGANEEAIRALTKLNYPWKPARLNNKSIQSKYVVPIAFDPEKKKKQ